jgi:curli biogenesis system outer membrane secretion channel CsgG
MLFFFIALGLSIAGFPQSYSQGAPAIAKPIPDTRTELTEKLHNVKRIYVESFGDDEVSKSLQAMVINALDATKRFIVTENKDKADAILKGRSVETTSQEVHATGEGTGVAAASGSHSEATGHGGFAAKAMGIQDSKLSTETTHEARLAVRLVSQDGDVLWSTTQESQGAKFKSSSADVADKVVKQLLYDLNKTTVNKM